MIGTLQILPRRVAQPVANAYAKLLDLAVPKLRRTVRTNLSFAFPELESTTREALINGVFRNIGRLLVALAKFPSIRRDNVKQWIRYEGLDNYWRAKEKGKGVLVATAHLGNWELSAFSHALMSEPMNVMVRPLDNPLIDRMVETRRQMSGNKLIFKKEAVRTVLRALQQNEAVGILIDQNTTPQEGVFIDFFGKKACASSAFVKLAAHSGAAVVPGFALWSETEQKYILRFFSEVEMNGDVTADTQRIHSLFEEVIRQHPDQWMWIHRRWKTRPPGEGPIY